MQKSGPIDSGTHGSSWEMVPYLTNNFDKVFFIFFFPELG